MKSIGYYVSVAFLLVALSISAEYIIAVSNFQIAVGIFAAFVTIHAHLTMIRSDLLKSIEELKEKPKETKAEKGGVI